VPKKSRKKPGFSTASLMARIAALPGSAGRRARAAITKFENANQIPATTPLPTAAQSVSAIIPLVLLRATRTRDVPIHHAISRCGPALALGLALLAAPASCAPADAGGTAEPVSTSERLTVDGAQLFLLTRGAERRAPVLLWLHGGPGGAERPLFRYFNGALEDHFIVAYWDQRGAGRSFDPEADPRELTIARHLADLDAVVDHLRRSFGRDEILLIGHSWGGALGLLYVRDHPEKVSAFIGVAPVVAPRAGQQAEYEFVLDEATRREDEDALAQLRALGAPPYASASDVLAVEAIADRYGAVFHQRPNRAWMMLRGIAGGLVTPWEIPRLIRGNRVSLDAMTGELLDLDLFESVPRVEVPVSFLLGRYDRHVDARLSARYLEQLTAPSKKLTWFEGSAHNVPFEEPERFDQSVIEALSSIPQP
jgi:pimeloyl-ACP methyl ester carboxylesterase